MSPTPARAAGLAAWIILLAVLLSARLPAVVEPAGSDQSLYMYEADRILDGGAPYVDAWDQKPPGVSFVYAAVRTVWPRASAVAVADVVAAGLTAVVLVILGWHILGPRLALVGAATYLLLSHPSIQRLSGLYVRGQSEVFIGLMVTASLAFVWRRSPERHHLVAAGLTAGMAVWLKYNAVAYVLPFAMALAVPPDGSRRTWREVASALRWIALGVIFISAGFLVFLAEHNAIDAWWRATVDYNLAYSGETYTNGPLGAVRYVISLPFDRMRADMLWYLGGVGLVLCLLGRSARQRPVGLLAALWIGASVLSIAANGARDLPQYFVQAGPALAFAFASGLATLRDAKRWLSFVAAGLILVGLWRVGTDAPSWGGWRWAGLPGAAANIATDIRMATGQIDEREFLARFKGQQKYDALEAHDLAAHIRATTAPSDRILVFGFAPSVYLDSGRRSASRFFWSRPVVLEFAAEVPGYGSRGLLADLDAAEPAVIALQKQDWGPREPNSDAFFTANNTLGPWLRLHYVRERDTPFFSVWRRQATR
jgi:hypothetical protein